MLKTLIDFEILIETNLKGDLKVTNFESKLF